MAGNPSFDIRETAAKALYEAHVAMAMEEGIPSPFYRWDGALPWDRLSERDKDRFRALAGKAVHASFDGGT